MAIKLSRGKVQEICELLQILHQILPVLAKGTKEQNMYIAYFECAIRVRSILSNLSNILHENTDTKKS